MLKINKNFYIRSLALAGAIALANPSLPTPVRAKTELQSIPLEWNHNSPDFSQDGRPNEPQEEQAVVNAKKAIFL